MSKLIVPSGDLFIKGTTSAAPTRSIADGVREDITTPIKLTDLISESSGHATDRMSDFYDYALLSVNGSSAPDLYFIQDGSICPAYSTTVDVTASEGSSWIAVKDVGGTWVTLTPTNPSGTGDGTFTVGVSPTIIPYRVTEVVVSDSSGNSITLTIVQQGMCPP
jgi:hypothetical protein